MQPPRPVPNRVHSCQSAPDSPRRQCAPLDGGKVDNVNFTGYFALSQPRALITRRGEIRLLLLLLLFLFPPLAFVENALDKID